MNWYLAVLQKYAVFQGRARRKEYWMFALFNAIISVGIGVVDAIMGVGQLGGIGVLSGLYLLLIILPSIAVGVRRLHDIGRSGWWLLIVLVPIIGAIVLLVFSVLDSAPGDNEYGANPKSAFA